MVDWPDFGLPRDRAAAEDAIREAFARAARSELVEIGCVGGLGRTGTVLACMAVLASVPAQDAVAWVRQHYDPRAIETPEQEAFVRAFRA